MKSDKPPSGKDLADVPLMQVTHDHLLNEAVKVTQPVDGYRVGSDAVLLAASIGTTTGRVLDLGAGVGGVCLCLAQRLVELQVTAVEKNADMAALCNENATQNGLQTVSYTHLRAHETRHDLVCRLLLEKKKNS